MKLSRDMRIFLSGAIICIVSIPLACSFGPLQFTFADVAIALFPGGNLPETVVAITPKGGYETLSGETANLILAQMRLPRALLSFITGAALSVAGVVFQAILRNPLADPFTLGVSGGSAFGAALAISLGLTGYMWGYGLPLFAFAGAGVALLAVLALGGIGGGLRHETLILAGVVVSAFLAALIALVKALDEASVTGIVFWLMGSFQGRGSRELALVFPGLVLGGCLTLALTRALDLLSLGDQDAQHIGLDTAKTRLLLLLGAGGITASCVAVSGIIGFVGLIVPHLCRMILGAEHRILLPACIMGGGVLLLWSDTVARSLLPGGVELPVGVITALLGGPFFCWILGKKKGYGKNCTTIRQVNETPKKTDTEWAETSFYSQSNTPHVQCEHLVFHYPKSVSATLKDISFSLTQGEFTGLLGPNGSGKSTLLQCLAGTQVPTNGIMLVEDQEISEQRSRQRARMVAYLSQNPESVPPLSVFALVLMGRFGYSGLFGSYSDEDKGKVWQVLEQVGASHLAFRAADCLSGGELQRVLLARSLVQDSKLLLLDEVTAGLDPHFQTSILDSIYILNRRQGMTVFAVMHDLNLAALYCKRLIFLKEGRIVAEGSPSEVIRREILEEVYGAELAVMLHPVAGVPQALPLRGLEQKFI